MAVDQHPDSETLKAFREHRLAGSVVAEVALHVAACSRCAKVEPTAGRAALRALASREADDHLSDEEVDVLADRRTDAPAHDRASRHAKSCAMCRAEVEDLLVFDAERPEGVRLSPPRPWKGWRIAAAILFAVLMLSAISLLLRRTTPETAPVTASNDPSPVAPATSAPPASRVVASLVDDGGRIELLEDGTVAGIEVRSPRDAEDARAVLSGRSIAIPTFVAAMTGAVRGAEVNARPPRAIAPFRSAVLESRPRFSWTPVPDARGYRVAVFDADYEEVAGSEVRTGTSWTPSKPLPAGVDLSWHVVAETEAGEISSAGSNRGEAVFRVLTPKEAAEVDLGEAHYRDSHLLRGLLYSRHGLLHAAEREFRVLGERNPDSPIARALIDSVSR